MPSDLSGGTFTISNGGVFGSLLSTPIVNLPQSGVLGMHAIQDRPIALAGQVVIRPMMYLALTYDHRVVDGREAVTFLKRIKDSIETPRLYVNRSLNSALLFSFTGPDKIRNYGFMANMSHGGAGRGCIRDEVPGKNTPEGRNNPPVMLWVKPKSSRARMRSEFQITEQEILKPPVSKLPF